MKTNLFIIVISLIVIGVISLVVSHDTPSNITLQKQNTSQAPEYSSVPTFQINDIYGNPINIEDYKGRSILINFWATWCAPCVVEFPALLEFAKTHPDIIVLTLSNDSKLGEVQTFLEKQKQDYKAQTNFILGWDPKRNITQDVFQTYRLPETIFINKDGFMIHKIIGPIDFNDPGFLKYIEMQSE